jgi:uncharacterized protein (DUF342 family)
MVDFAQLQAAVKERLEEDLSIQTVEAEGDSLETAISEAATLLNVPVRHLEYEIIEKQSSFFGIGQNLCKIRAYERFDIKKKREAEAILAEDIIAGAEELEVVEFKNGDAFVQMRFDGVYLKITPPYGVGDKASLNDAIFALQRRNIVNFDRALVGKLLRAASGEYERICDYNHIPLNDTSLEVEIADQEMKAFITVSPPGEGGADLTFEDYMSSLTNNQITYGIDKEFLKNFADKPLFRQRVCVATGKQPVDGMNSFVEYYFETDQNKIRLKETTDGKVDFKELNIIQNVFEGEKLGKVNPAEAGEMGFTVTGRAITAKDGKDFPVTLGKNVHFGEDGATIIADINGQVVMSNAKINVESIFTVDGSVNLKTGNIIFLGTVVVTGNVEEGFAVKASGNIEVHGTVDKASLDAEGSIIVRQGITGKEGAQASAGRSIWAKFIENAMIKCGDMVVVSDGIINSSVDAAKRIICQGKRAAIIGGRLRAAEEISAKSLGSPSGNTETICEVGFDPKSKAELESLTAHVIAATSEFDDIQLNLQTLNNIKQQRGTLPEDREQYLTELTEKRNQLSKEIAETNEQRAKLDAFLKELTVIGRVSASTKVHPGVIIVIRDARETVRNEYKAVTFVLENDLVRAQKYIESDADTTQTS